MRSAIYAGSFDPVTFGHIDILNKARKLFDKVYILVAHNPGKNHLLTLDERIELMRSSTCDLEGIEVVFLPYGETIAHQAQELNVQYLVRGLRGHTDLDGEMVNARINKEININLETIIFVTEIDLGELSSSLVRSVVGLRDWTKILKKRVPQQVIDKLEEKYFQSLLCLSEKEWLRLKNSLNKPYHNLRHSFDVFNQVYYDVKEELDKEAVVWASLYHDICSSEEKSYELWKSEYFNKNAENTDLEKRVYDLIIATDHSKQLSKEQLNDDVICRFVAADLMILASDWEDYKIYAKNVRKEYLEFSDQLFKEGRVEFLGKMLERKMIFPGLNYSYIERKARLNMNNELSILQVELDE